ncbi:putative RING-H2 finger protein ATL62 [Vicia villosa]|uniref:putative RING-H2 finger protein ATL62 n=1 Tax=Vicia villosa TaxID=3911 RepID=UPI00273C3D06|nr:putative RING-H2 finger protein ATL62 [Vicia villosa]
MNVSTMFEKSIFINCEHFFARNSYVLWFYLHRITSSFPYFTFENLNRITRNLIPQVKELFDISHDFVGLEEPMNNEYREKVIPVILNIFVDVYPCEERRNQEMIEESLQFVKMIPASNEAILSLKACSLPRNCSICLEKFHDDLEEDGDGDNVKVSTMACGHIFHYNCIVEWLQTSHVCPLCRYAMPT